jgi:orotidine-5'-phosphate decarboxylase
MHFADQLSELVRQKQTPLCVGLDPRWESLPQLIRAKHSDGTLRGVAHAYEDFCLTVLELVAPHVGVVKPQSAFFEAAGTEGMKAQQRVIARAKELGLSVILDAKRGDIASTATAYADAAFDGSELEGRRLPIWNADSLTVNPYLGRDAIEPFIQAARRDARGLFVLVRTSNPGSGLFQNLISEKKPLYRHVADAVVQWNSENLGECGLGDIGAVVGATHPKELAELREAMPTVWFLVPGYGAQGGSAADVAPAFLDNGLGALVNSSRGITFPFKPDDAQWKDKILAATIRSAQELKEVAKL